MPVDPGPTSWRFDRSAITLTQPGQSVVVQLQQVSPNGADTGATPPPDPPVQQLGDSGAVIVDDLGNGSFRFTATARIGSIVLAVDVPGRDLDVPVSVMNARLQPDVVTVPDSQLLYPPPNLPATGNIATAGLPGIDASHVGPFTWQELRDRTLVDEGTAGTPAAGARIPVVLIGAAPAIGTTLYGTGDHHVSGTVVSLAGLPSIERDGYALVSLRVETFDVLFSQVHWDFTYDQFADAALVPLEYRMSRSCSDAVAAEDCPQPSVATIIAGVNDQPGRGRVTHSSPLTQRRPSALPDNCTAEGSASLADIKFLGGEGLHPKGSWLATDGVGGVGIRAQVEFGFDLTVTLGASVKLQLAGSYGVNCTLRKLAQFEMPAELLGPWAQLITPFLDADVVGVATAQFAGGPRIDLAKSCSWTFQVRAGFSYTEDIGYESRNRFEKVPNADPCPAGTASVSLGTGADAPMSIDLSLFGGPKLTAGVHFGGITTHWLGEIFGNKDYGDFPILSGKVGPQLHVNWENSQNALSAKAAGATVALELAGDIGVEGPFLTWLLDKLGAGGGPGLSVQLVSGTVTLATLYRPLNTSALAVTVSGEDRPSDSVEVRPGDTLRVESTLQYKASALPLTDAVPLTGSDWVKPGGLVFLETDLFTSMTSVPQAPGSDQTMVYSATITPALCDSIGTDAKEISLLADAPMFGVLPTPAYAGVFTLSCVPTAWEFREGDAITIERDQVDTTHFVHIKHAGYAGYSWSLANTNGSDLPAWLTISDGGTVPFGTADIDVSIDIDCDAMAVKERTSLDVKAAVADPPNPNNQHEDILTINVDCRDPFLEVTPARLEGSGTLQLKTWGRSVGVWKVDPASVAGAPEWLKTAETINITPDHGVYGNGTHTENLTVTVEPWPNDCVAHRAVGYDVRFITEYRSGTQEDRKTATVRVVRPARPQPAGCTGNVAGSGGDPHLSTFDGVPFDAQVLGEYTYVRPVGGANTPVIQARHEMTDPAAVRFANPTSVTAVVVSLNGHKVEVYQRPDLLLLVDGQPYNLADTQSVTVGGGLVLTRSGITYSFDTDTIVGSVTPWSAGLNLSLWAPSGTPVEGLLGSPDGNQANDLATAGGTQYPVGEVRQHGDALYALTDSWRITNPVASLFTRSYDGFEDVQPVYSSAALEPFRQQVRDLLGQVAVICATSGGAADHTIDALALELAIGRPLGDLGEFTCQYAVQGYATGGPSSLAVEGLQVTIDGVGVQPCTVVTNTSGYYLCTMHVAFDELANVDPDTLPVRLTAVFPEEPDTTVVDEAISFPGHAALTGTAQLSHAIDVPIEFFPSLAVSGHLTGAGGAPLVRPVSASTYFYDANHAFIGQVFNPVTPSPYDGAYSFLQALPRKTVYATVLLIGLSNYSKDNRSINVDNLTRGRREATFDVQQRPPTLRLHGTLTRNGAPEGSAWGVLYDAYRTDGSLIGHFGRNFTVSQADGSYTSDITLPNDTVRVVVLSRYYFTTAFDEFSQEFTNLQPDEQRDAPFSFDYVAKSLQISGNLTVDGAVVDGIVRYSLVMLDADGQYVSSAFDQRGMVNGDHTITFNLSSRTATVQLVVRHTAGSPDGQLFTVPIVAGANSLDASFDDTLTTLSISGRIVCSGQPHFMGRDDLNVYPSDSAGHRLPTQSVGIYTDTEGNYSTVLRLPRTATEAYLVIGACGGFGQINRTVTIVPQTDNPVVFDVNTGLLSVSGRIVGTPEQVAAIEQNGLSFDIDELLDENTNTIRTSGPINPSTEWVVDADDNLIALDYTFDWLLVDGAASVDLSMFEEDQDRTLLAQATFSGLGFTDNNVVFDVDLNAAPGTTPLTFDFLVIEDGYAKQFLPVQVGVHAYEYTDWSQPHVEVGSDTLSMETDGTAHARGAFQLPPTATLARITVRFQNSDQQWNYTVFITPGTPATFFYPIDLSAGRLTYSGNIVLDNCPSPLVFYRQVWTFMEAPTQPYDWDTGTWPGGQLVWSSYVVPDSVPDVNGQYHHEMTTQFPADAVWLGTVYSGHNGNGTGGGPIAPGSFIGKNVDETVSCP